MGPKQLQVLEFDSNEMRQRSKQIPNHSSSVNEILFSLSKYLLNVMGIQIYA